MGYAKSDLIDVQAFTRQREGEDVVIGLPAKNAYLSLPAEALELLDSLSHGKTIGGAQAEFARAHGVVPDIDDLLTCLEKRGFVRLRSSDAPARPLPEPAVGSAVGRARHHFTAIPQSIAKRFFGPFALALYLTTVAAALLIAATRPSLIPGRSSLVFSEHRTAKVLLLSLVAYGTLFLHEFAHLLAAKARGVESRIGFSNRLWVLVAETDLTGLWAVPKRQRYLPMLAGPLLDSFSAAFLFLVYTESQPSLSPAVGQLIRALIFVYLFRLLWQCNLFVRTDFYYVIATFFNCKSLMRDTEVFIGNLLRRAVGSTKRADQSHIPLRERRVIAMYSILWVLGRGVALASLCVITLPVVYRYLDGAVLAVRQGAASHHYEYIDSVLVGALNLAPLAIGMSLWITSIARRRKTT